MSTSLSRIELAPDQKAVLDFAVERLRTRATITTIGGYAGTGKSTVTGEIVNVLRECDPKARIAFACYTGKAKDVLERKLRTAGALRPGDFCGTLHGLLYRPVISYRRDEEVKTIEKIVTFDSKEAVEKYACIIIDEASMINEEIYEELMDLGVPILAVGDHGQLPPVFGDFNLMKNPMMKLEKIHRQEEGDPIIRASLLARETGEIPMGELGPNVVKTRDGGIVDKAISCMHEDWMLVCGTNRKRIRLNGWMRHRKLGRNYSEPVRGDKVICLQNNHKAGIFNGMAGILLGFEVIDRHWYQAEIDMGDFVYQGRIFRWQFGKERCLNKTSLEAPEIHPDNFKDLFDYGYCLTAHKAQGNEADNVVVFEEAAMRWMLTNRHGQEGWRRWLYTAVTRARKNLIIIEE